MGVQKDELLHLTYAHSLPTPSPHPTPSPPDPTPSAPQPHPRFEKQWNLSLERLRGMASLRGKLRKEFVIELESKEFFRDKIAHF